jgi:PleD family two-component response regulator
MVTSNGQLQDVMNGIKAGVNDYVVKPINPEILTQKVKKNISNLTIVNTIAR